MRLLFEMDKKDYAGCTHIYVRNSARSIIIVGGKIAMVHSLKYDYYKFPGGGIEQGGSGAGGEAGNGAGIRLCPPDSKKQFR